MTTNHLTESVRVFSLLEAQCLPSAEKAAQAIAAAFASNHKLLLCGNGGSAADCQHMAAEFTSRLHRERDRKALPAIALTTDTSFITAYANDVNFDGIFMRQVEALGQPGDVLIGISTSGNSKNVLLAFEEAKKKQMTTISLTGTAGTLPTIADIAITIPSDDTQCIQEACLALEHCMCEIVEKTMFG